MLFINTQRRNDKIHAVMQKLSWRNTSSRLYTIEILMGNAFVTENVIDIAESL